ncbi:MAG: hypothetical protein DRN95_02030 [Candidatus Hydrothermarchaeota archaeon]|nr:MAG: hypothetical protein DRN95_02030 [Candidatus Hydrothermarchaeota archaeon]
MIAILLYMIFIEPREKRIYALIVMIYSGIFGLIVLQSKKALFPALTGLFGISTLVISMKKKANIPEQSLNEEIEPFPRGIILGTLAGIFSGLFPRVGSSQSAMVMQNFIRKREKSKEEETKEFLVALGGVNTVDAIYAFLALYLIGKPRSGASIAVEKILQYLSYRDFLYILGIILSSSFLAVLITLRLSRFLIQYEKISLLTLFFLLAMILFFSGERGLLIAFVASSIGIFAQLSGVKKSNCMAVLIIPTILYFLP